MKPLFFRAQPLFRNPFLKAEFFPVIPVGLRPAFAHLTVKACRIASAIFRVMQIGRAHV